MSVSRSWILENWLVELDTGSEANFAFNLEARRRRVVSTATGTIMNSDAVLEVTATATTAVTLTLSAASGFLDGSQVTVLDRGRNASQNHISVVAAGSDTVQGESNLLMNLDGMCISLQTDGVSAWSIV